MGQYDFKADIKIAETTEKEISQFLVKYYGFEHKRFNSDYKFDLVMVTNRKKGIFIEVKEDFMTKATGNVALEYECRGKPSGINTSKADVFIYKVHTKEKIDYIMIPTSLLRKEIQNKTYFKTHTTGGDSGSNTHNYLFKYETFLSFGVVLDFEGLDD